ncbi:hypothetical protein PIB30_095348 [Stylosanthes scabra]|uniref:Uncharacterized protein n=1 Tax=Stylosanthes scabra TaxID=79078 RepID=A0ABU6XUZ3_9FABA|nr:hypothetical protein [Stylosanthes scabra]
MNSVYSRGSTSSTYEQQMMRPHASARRSHPSAASAPVSAATPPSAAPSAPRRPHHVPQASGSAHPARPGIIPQTHRLNLLSQVNCLFLAGRGRTGDRHRRSLRSEYRGPECGREETFNAKDAVIVIRLGYSLTPHLIGINCWSCFGLRSLQGGNGGLVGEIILSFHG